MTSKAKLEFLSSEITSINKMPERISGTLVLKGSKSTFNTTAESDKENFCVTEFLKIPFS